MLNDRLEIARPFAKRIKELEANMNTSIRLIGQMMVDIPAAREKIGKHVDLEAGVDACESLAAAAMAAAQGYRQVVQLHHNLAEDRDRLGLKTVGWGDVHECPPKKPQAENPTHLVVVGAA